MDLVFQEEKKTLENIEAKINKAACDLESKIYVQNQKINGFECVDYADIQALAALKLDNKRNSDRAKEIRSYQDSPYFGRMDLYIESENEEDTFYIGKKSIMFGSDCLVVDWRSSLGQCFYMKSEKQFHAGDTDYILQLRRALDIKNGKLLSYKTEFDSETVALEGDVIDPFLLTVLKDKRRANRLTDIIRSIQTNQNEIIRKPINESFIVQGCAGSGKTMILLHRLSYLLFNNRNIPVDKIKIITPNSLFDSTINELSNELGLNRIERKSVEGFYVGLIKSYSTRIDVTSSVESEKELNPRLLKIFYSDYYYRDTCINYDNYWKDIFDRISKLGVEDIAFKVGLVFQPSNLYEYSSYKSTKILLNKILNLISKNIEEQNILINQINSLEKSKNKAEENKSIKEENFSNLVKAISSRLEERIVALNAKSTKLQAIINTNENKIDKLKNDIENAVLKVKNQRSLLGKIKRYTDNISNYADTSNKIIVQIPGLLEKLSVLAVRLQKVDSTIINTSSLNIFKKKKLTLERESLVKKYNEVADKYIKDYLFNGYEDVQASDKYIYELENKVKEEESTIVSLKDKYEFIIDKISYINQCYDLIRSNELPNSLVLQDNIYGEVIPEIEVYEKLRNEIITSETSIKTISNSLNDYIARYQRIKDLNITADDSLNINEALVLLEKLKISEVSRNVMLKDILETYRICGEKYRKGNYRFKLYLRLLLCYLYYKKNISSSGLFINIDEAQDMSVAEYKLLRLVLGKNCIFNLYGDSNQLVYQYKGVGDWGDLKSVITDRIYTLNENYRNTMQITEFCNEEFSSDMYPIGISGDNVRSLTFDQAIGWIFIVKDSHPEIRCAIIYKHSHIGIKNVLNEKLINKDVSWLALDDNKVSVLTVEKAKGLEFEVVVCITDEMTDNEKYISYTRALDRLVVVNDHFEVFKDNLEDNQDENGEELIINDFDDEALIENEDEKQNDISMPISKEGDIAIIENDNTLKEDTKDTAKEEYLLEDVPNTDVPDKLINEDAVGKISQFISDAFGEKESLDKKQLYLVDMLLSNNKIACSADSGYKKSIILFSIAKYVHDNIGKQSIITSDAHLQENELILAESLGLKVGSIVDSMNDLLVDFKKEKYDVIFVPYSFFKNHHNVIQFIDYFNDKIAYWGIDHPTEEKELWNVISIIIDKVSATPYLMSKNGFVDLDLKDFKILNFASDVNYVDQVKQISFIDNDSKLKWISDNAFEKLSGHGLIYCDKENECKEICRLLRKKKIMAEAYIDVFNTSNSERINYLANSFTRGAMPVLVTTQDVGKNLTNPNINFIVHFDIPDDNETYKLHVMQLGNLAKNPTMYDLKVADAGQGLDKSDYNTINETIGTKSILAVNSREIVFKYNSIDHFLEISKDKSEMISSLENSNVKVYRKGEIWKDKNSKSIYSKIVLPYDAIVFSFYIKKQLSIIALYTRLFEFRNWKYNLLVDLSKLDIFLERLKVDYDKGQIVAETFNGPGKDTSGVFIESNSGKRIDIEF